MKHFTEFFLLAIGLALSCQPKPKTPQLVDQKLVYLAVRDGNYDLFLSDEDGSNEIQLTTQPGFDWGARWSPALNGILHYTQDTAGNFSHQLISATGEPIKYAFPDLPDYQLDHLGNRVAFTEKVGESTHIFVQELPKDEAEEITMGDAYFGRPKWSPVATELLMVSDITGNSELHLYLFEDNRLEQLTSGEGRAKYASWSPDGQKIAFTREVLEEPKKEHEIYILDMASREVTQLTHTTFGEQEISWSPMGDKIAYHGTIDGKDHIYTLDIATGEVVKVTNGQGYHGEPTWAPIYR